MRISDWSSDVCSSDLAYHFRARRIADTIFESRPAVRFRVEPDSLLRWFVEPLELTYDPQQHELLEYRGVANIPNPASGKPYIARIAYYSDRKSTRLNSSH